VLPTAADATAVTTEPTLPPETEPPKIPVNEALSNIWDIMDNECVEEIPILPGLLLDDIEDWMEETEFKEIKLHQRTYWNTVRLGVYEDMAVARISMLEGDNFSGEELVWNVRMEKADKLENKTAIEIPEDADTGEYEVLGKGGKNTVCRYYNWITSGNADAIKAGVRDVHYFRIRMLGEEKTYQYRYGMTCGQWIKSEFNTDGWTLDSKESLHHCFCRGPFQTAKRQLHLAGNDCGASRARSPGNRIRQLDLKHDIRSITSFTQEGKP